MNDIEAHRNADLVEIRALIERYFHGLDARDHEALASSFADDASVVYFHGTPQATALHGGGTIADHFMGIVARFESSTHAVANVTITMAGDTGRGDTFAVAYVVVDGKVLVRGLRYLDVFVRSPAGWRIRERKHLPLWQFDAQSAPPAVPQ